MGINTIRIEVPSSPQAFAYRQELEDAGLKWGQDFRWKYNPSQSNWDYENNVSAWVEFTFTDAKLATYYRMKWQ